MIEWGVAYATASRRTLANAAIVDGFFGFMWFGWGQAGPPPGVAVVLAIGSVLAALVAVAGILCARRARDEPSPLTSPTANRRYGIIVGTEFGSIVVGAVILGVTGHPEFTAAWVCFVVGVHFLPLDRVFPGIGLVGLAIAVTAVAIAAFVVGLSTDVLPSTVAGLGAGTCLLVHATSLLIARRQARR